MSGIRRLANIWRVADLRGKVLFTLFVVLVYRVGAHVTVPFVDFAAIKSFRDAESATGGIVPFLDLFTGGAITNVAVFFLGIMPYITASIVVQLLGVAIPRIERWQGQGKAGQRKITQWTRYLTLVLAFAQSTGFVFALRSGGGGALGITGINLPPGVEIIPDFNLWKASVIILTWTAGMALLMWFGELINQRGIGNGMSILIFASVVSRLPRQLVSVYSEGRGLEFAVLLVAIAMIVGIVFVESGVRRIPVQFSKLVVGGNMYGGRATHIPLKVNQGGTVALIFASSILQLFSAMLAIIVPWQLFRTFVDDNLVGSAGTTWSFIGIYALMIMFAAYFYSSISYNPAQLADMIRLQGGFIPGIRAGPPTERYLARVISRITLPGACFLAVIALVPFVVFKFWGITQFPFGGTKLLITVGVALETMRQIDHHLLANDYPGFLHASKKKRRRRRRSRPPTEADAEAAEGEAAAEQAEAVGVVAGSNPLV